MKRKTPVAIDKNTFSNREYATLYVPAGSKAAYEAADYWNEFGEIVETDDVEPGDANGDGRVTVTDIGVVVNDILQLANDSYSEGGADANKDGKVTVTDIGAIVDIILGNSSQGQ